MSTQKLLILLKKNYFQKFSFQIDISPYFGKFFLLYIRNFFTYDKKKLHICRARLQTHKINLLYYIKTPYYANKFFLKYLNQKCLDYSIKKHFSRLIVLRSPKHFNIGKIQVLNSTTSIRLMSKTYNYTFWSHLSNNFKIAFLKNSILPYTKTSHIKIQTTNLYFFVNSNHAIIKNK